MTTIRVAIPCRRFAVRAHLGYTDGLSQFEQFALRGLAIQSATAPELAQLLGLDERMTLDLCVDLVKSGLAELHVVLVQDPQDLGRCEARCVLSLELGKGSLIQPVHGLASRRTSSSSSRWRAHSHHPTFVRTKITLFHSIEYSQCLPPLIFAHGNERFHVAHLRTMA